MSRQDAELRPNEKHCPERRSSNDEPASNLPASSLLAKGSLVLESLALKAAAARAEAEKVELQLLIDKAEAGELAPLQAWLEENSPGCLRPEALHQSPEEPSLAKSEAKPVVADGAEQSSGWDSDQGRAWLAASRERLGLGSPVGESSSQASHQTVGPSQRAAATPSAKRGEDDKSKKLDRTKVGGKQPDVAAATVSRHVLAAVTDVLEGEQPEAGGAKKSRLAGIAASVIAHVVLLFVLAVITLKLPPDAAGLAFQSASPHSIEPVMEVAQDVTADLPESQETAEVAELAVDPSESLSDIQANVKDSLDQLALQNPGTSASSIMSATAATSLSLPTGEATSFFGAAAGGNNFCYVIDASGSMRGGPWQAAKFELLKSLASLKSNQRYYIICFNRQLSPMVLDGPGPAPSPVYATAENLQKTRRWIETIEIGIGAPPNKALEYAIDLEPDAVYFLSDGVTKVDVAAFLRGINHVESLLGDIQVRVPIHPIAYYSLEGQTLLRQIAAENRGQFVYVPDPTK